MRPLLSGEQGGGNVAFLSLFPVVETVDPHLSPFAEIGEDIAVRPGSGAVGAEQIAVLPAAGSGGIVGTEPECDCPFRFGIQRLGEPVAELCLRVGFVEMDSLSAFSLSENGTAGFGRFGSVQGKRGYCGIFKTGIEQQMVFFPELLRGNGTCRAESQQG